MTDKEVKLREGCFSSSNYEWERGKIIYEDRWEVLLSILTNDKKEEWVWEYKYNLEL